MLLHIVVCWFRSNGGYIAVFMAGTGRWCPNSNLFNILFLIKILLKMAGWVCCSSFGWE
jgi:hypothetical protein